MKNKDEQQVRVVPKNYTSVTPWIISASSIKLIDFMNIAFGAEEIPFSRMYNKDGSIAHVEVKIGSAIVMLFDSKNDWYPTPSFLRLFVEDIEKVYQKSIKAGATSVTNITTLFFGEKVCRIRDPFNNIWWIHQRIEELDNINPEEIAQRASAPDAIEAMEYVQNSLDEALKKRG